MNGKQGLESGFVNGEIQTITMLSRKLSISCIEGRNRPSRLQH
jgi:hypothetical protein